MASSQNIVEYFRGRDACGHDGCRSKRFYVENGLTYCKRGHEQEGVRQYGEDDRGPSFSSQGQTTRAQKERQAKQSRILSGGHALSLYLSCYQMILRHQCWALIHEKGFPQELELLVKDLWALRLPLIHEKVGKGLNTGSEDETADEEDSAAPKLFSSQNESSGDEGESDVHNRGDQERDLPSVLDSLSLCYMAIILLRSPISLGQLHRWAVREEVPLVRPLRLIPRNVRRNLPIRYINLLETHHSIGLDDLNRSLYKLIALYHAHFELSLPVLNYQPLLFWHIRRLALPLQLYTAVRQLASILSETFTFSLTKTGRYLSLLPETKLLSLLMIAIKLYHPLEDDTEHYVRSMTDPAYLTINWKLWSTARKHQDDTLRASKPFLPGEQMSVKESDVPSLSAGQIDSYLDWYDQTWTEPEKGEGRHVNIPQELIDMFPTMHPASLPPVLPTRQDNDSENETATTTRRLYTVLGGLNVRSVISDESAGKQTRPVPRVGSRYRDYKDVDDLEEVAAEVYACVAAEGALEVGTLLKAVRRMERSLTLWWEERRKEDRDTVRGVDTARLKAGDRQEDARQRSESGDKDLDLDMEVEPEEESMIAHLV